jgi:hypothetical protein
MKARGKGHYHAFEPPNPASVVEEKFCKEYFETNKTGMTKTDIYSKENIKKFQKENGIGFEPPNPASVVEEEKIICKTKGFGWDGKEGTKICSGNQFEPPNPASVVEEKNEGQKKAKQWGYNKCSSSFDNNEEINGGRRIGANYEPPNPASVVEDTDIYGETKEQRQKIRECDCMYDLPNPASVVESTKVFIGKRNHQTEKPQDVLEFLIKYWTDEDDVVLDPTMGSGSTGVACQTLNRKFIGFELDPKIYEVAYNRINKIDLKTDTKKNKKKKPTKKI